MTNRVLQGWVKNVPNDGPALLSPVSLPGVVGFFTWSTFGTAFHLSPMMRVGQEVSAAMTCEPTTNREGTLQPSCQPCAEEIWGGDACLISNEHKTKQNTKEGTLQPSHQPCAEESRGSDTCTGVSRLEKKGSIHQGKI